MIERLWYMGLWGSVLILVVLLLRQILKKYPKIYSYCLWGLVFLRLLCPIFIESSMSLQPDFLHSAEYLTAITNVTAGGGDQVHQAGDLYRTGSVAAVETQYAEQKKIGPAAEEGIAIPVGSILKIGYLAGAFFFGGCFLVQYLFIKKRVAAAIREKENIWQSEHIVSPFVMGMFFPKIYLPYTLAGDEKGYILRHEQMHIRHFDTYTRFLGILACCLHWWNPLVWYAVSKLNEDMEMFCDEAAVAGVSYAERKAYANTLLSFSIRQSRLPVVLAFGESHTEKRVKNVLEKKRGSALLTALMILITLICAFGFLTIPGENAFAGTSEQEEFSYIQMGGRDMYIYSDASAAEPDFYSAATTHLSAQEIELYAQAVRIMILTHDWEGLAGEIIYPINIKNHIISSSEQFGGCAPDMVLSKRFFASIQDEDCREMYHNEFGIRMGEDGWVTIKVIYDEKTGEWVPKISGIVDKGKTGAILPIKWNME